MWKNGNMKEDAKFHLRSSWVYAVVVCLLVQFIIGSISQVFFMITGFGGALLGGLSTVFQSMRMGGMETVDPDLLMLRNLPFMFFMWFANFLIIFAVSIFVSFPLMVGQKNWFVRNREVPQAQDLQAVFEPIKENYKSLAFAGFWQSLWLGVWSLLYILPTAVSIFAAFMFASTERRRYISGAQAQLTQSEISGIILLVVAFILFIAVTVIFINRTFAYLMMSYILADNPHINAKRAMNLSKKMMKKNKMHLFGLSLSFIPWAFLAIFTCGIGFLFLTPYMEQTYAEVYARLRNFAVERGETSMEELGFISTVSASDVNSARFQEGYDSQDPRFPSHRI